MPHSSSALKKKILVIDGQGGKLGRLVIEQLKALALGYEIGAVGTNSIATAAMLKAGADWGATGENSVVISCRNADIIIGPMGILVADSLHGEVTAAMSTAVGACQARKVLIPISRCRVHVAGVAALNTAELVAQAISYLQSIYKDD